MYTRFNYSGVRVHARGAFTTVNWSRRWRSRTSPVESESIAIPSWSAGCGRLTENGRWVIPQSMSDIGVLSEKNITAAAAAVERGRMSCSSGILLRCVGKVESGLRQSIYRPCTPQHITDWTSAQRRSFIRLCWWSTTATECRVSRTPSTPCRSAVGPRTSRSTSTRAGCRGTWTWCLCGRTLTVNMSIDRLHITLYNHNDKWL